jgi:hypothetical protein
MLLSNATTVGGALFSSTEEPGAMSLPYFSKNKSYITWLKGHMSYTPIPIHIVVRNMSRYNDNEEKFKSIRSNTISEQLYTDLREDYGFPPAVCRSLAENFLDIMDLYYGGERDPGQVIYNAASSDVPAGRPREDVRTVPVQLTLFDPKDIDIVVEQGIEPTFRSFEKA